MDAAKECLMRFTKVTNEVVFGSGEDNIDKMGLDSVQGNDKKMKEAKNYLQMKLTKNLSQKYFCEVKQDLEICTGINLSSKYKLYLPLENDSFFAGCK